MTSFSSLRAPAVAFLLVLTGLTALATPFDNPDVILRTKGSKDPKVGALTGIDDASLTIKDKKGTSTTYKLDEINPYDLYQIYVKVIKTEDVKGHLDLAEFALKNKLYQQSMVQFGIVSDLDPNLKGKMDAKISEVKNTHALSLLEEAMDLLKKDDMESIKSAIDRLKEIMITYPESDYAAKAKEEDTKAQDKVRVILEKKKLDEASAKLQADQNKLKQLDKVVRDEFERIVKQIDDAKKSNKEGLTHDSSQNVGKARDAWQIAEGKLLRADADFRTLQQQTKDTQTLTAILEKLNEIKQELTSVYWSLGSMYLYHLNTAESLKWVNRGLALDPYSTYLKDLKLYIIQMRIKDKLPQ